MQSIMWSSGVAWAKVIPGLSRHAAEKINIGGGKKKNKNKNAC